MGRIRQVNHPGRRMGLATAAGSRPGGRRPRRSPPGLRSRLASRSRRPGGRPTGMPPQSILSPKGDRRQTERDGARRRGQDGAPPPHTTLAALGPRSTNPTGPGDHGRRLKLPRTRFQLEGVPPGGCWFADVNEEPAASGHPGLPSESEGFVVRGPEGDVRVVKATPTPIAGERDDPRTRPSPNPHSDEPRCLFGASLKYLTAEHSGYRVVRRGRKGEKNSGVRHATTGYHPVGHAWGFLAVVLVRSRSGTCMA
jgi:hypothetical protein